jgi:hypothetical protein
VNKIQGVDRLPVSVQILTRPYLPSSHDHVSLQFLDVQFERLFDCSELRVRDFDRGRDKRRIHGSAPVVTQVRHQDTAPSSQPDVRSATLCNGA